MHLKDKLLKAKNIEGMTKTSDLFGNENHFDDIVSLPKLFTDLSVNKNILKDDTTLLLKR